MNKILIMCLVSVFVLSCGCTSVSSPSFASTTTLRNGQEKVTIMENGTPYFLNCKPGKTCYLNTPLIIINSGNVGIRTTPRLSYTVTDYAGFKVDSDSFHVDGMYPGDAREVLLEIHLGTYDDPKFKKITSHDLPIKWTFGSDSAMWTIPASAFRHTPPAL